MPYFKIKNIPGMDGLIIEADASDMGTNVVVQTRNESGVPCVTKTTLFGVRTIINPGVAIGDSTLAWPQEFGSIFIDGSKLESIDYSPREWTTDSPFGKFKFEGHVQRDGIHIDYAVYEDGISVTICDDSLSPARTIYTQNFFGEFAETADDQIMESLHDSNKIDDLVFKLQELADKQRATLRRK